MTHPISRSASWCCTWYRGLHQCTQPTTRLAAERRIPICNIMKQYITPLVTHKRCPDSQGEQVWKLHTKWTTSNRQVYLNATGTASLAKAEGGVGNTLNCKPTPRTTIHTEEATLGVCSALTATCRLTHHQDTRSLLCKTPRRRRDKK